MTRLNKITAFVQVNLLKTQNLCMGENEYTTSKILTCSTHWAVTDLERFCSSSSTLIWLL